MDSMQLNLQIKKGTNKINSDNMLLNLLQTHKINMDHTQLNLPIKREIHKIN